MGRKGVDSSAYSDPIIVPPEAQEPFMLALVAATPSPLFFLASILFGFTTGGETSANGEEEAYTLGGEGWRP